MNQKTPLTSLSVGLKLLGGGLVGIRSSGGMAGSNGPHRRTSPTVTELWL